MDKKTAAIADASDNSALDIAISNEGQALVLSGGGARAAYQVGCLRALARSLPDYRPQILTGVSAGAINATHLAAFQGSWGESVEALVRLWQAMRTEQVYRTGLGHLAGRMAHWGLHFVSGGRLGRKDIRGMVYNKPLRRYLNEQLSAQPGTGEIPGVDRNLAEGWLKALAVVTTNYASGRSEAWVDTLQQQIWSGSQTTARRTSLTLDHVMASAALPFFFPSVKLQQQWHGDGGIRLAAPPISCYAPWGQAHFGGFAACQTPGGWQRVTSELSLAGTGCWCNAERRFPGFAGF